jgi:hypothetical protein
VAVEKREAADGAVGADDSTVLPDYLYAVLGAILLSSRSEQKAAPDGD